jgi:parallel beta-helix repeat protein
MFYLLLANILISAFNLQPVKAEPRTWIVDDDGPADFHTIHEALNAANDGDTIFVHNGTYYEHTVVNKTVSLIGENKEATIIEGNGTGTILNITANFVNVKGFTLQNCVICVGIYNSRNVTLENNTISNYASEIGTGIEIEFSNNVTVKSNLLIHNSNGIEVLNSSNNYFIDNNIIHCTDIFGVYLGGSRGNVLKGDVINHLVIIGTSGGNILRDNYIGRYGGFCVIGTELVDYIQDIDTSNTLWNGVIYYLINQHDISINPLDYPGIGYLALINSTNVAIEGLNMSGSGAQGILLAYTRDSQIINNHIAHKSLGGIFLSNSFGNNIIGNNLTENTYDIVLFNASNNNIIYHNNFIDNKLQHVYDPFWNHPEIYASSINNTWNDGYPSGGNYWSDYISVDFCSGPYQNMTGSDGIGDTPYIIDSNNTDHYPLMNPFTTFEAGVWNGTAYNIDVISNSTISDFNFDVDNKCVSFNVTGDDGTIGFCRAAIPKSLLWTDDGWTILVDDVPVTDYTKFEDENCTYLYFTYNHSKKTVTIKGTHAIPEFPTTPILIMLILTTLITTALWKTKRKR